MDLKQTLRELCLIPALSGHEQKLAAYLKTRFEACGLRVREDALGNCIALAPGAGAAQPTVMVFGHMDQLGFVVRYIEEDGFLRLERVGGIPERALPALEVEVQCRDGRMIPGVIGNKAHHATPPEEKYVVEKYTSLFVDIGAHSRAQVEGLGIRVGSPVVYAGRFRELLDGRVSATSLDNRVACAVLAALAERLRDAPVAVPVALVGTVQEEFNLRGAMVAGRTVRPALAVGLDIALEGGSPEMRGKNPVLMGRGPVLSLYNFHGRGTLNGTIPHPGMVRLFEQAAAQQGIPLQREATMGSLTDLSYLQLEGAGVKSVDIGVPCRYTHTPAEVCDLGDLQQTVDLVYAALARIPQINLEREGA